MLDIDKFHLFFKHTRGVQHDFKWFNHFVEKYKMTKDNLIHFMAQVGHESNLLRYKEELWNYSEKGLLQVFPKYFTHENSERYARTPKILDRAYANRMGNGDEDSGDGFRYRGRGYIQLTGKNNYEKYGYTDSPEFLSFYEGAWESAFKFWFANKLDTLDDIKKMTKIINGGYNGLDHRKELYEKAKKLIG